MYYLGFTNQYLWDIARIHIRAYHASYFGGWAGVKIAGLGDEDAPTDWPADLFTENEKKELEKSQGVPDPDGSKFKRFNDLALPGWDSYNMVCHCCRRPFFCEPDAEAVRAKAPGTGMLGTTLSDFRSFMPSDREWVLRNLTTREFVRSGALVYNERAVSGPWMARPGFGEVLVSRICRSPNPSGCIMELQRGIWAGHRFDITTMDRFPDHARPEQGWKDVGEEVAEEVATIWEQRFGREWRYHMFVEHIR